MRIKHTTIYKSSAIIFIKTFLLLKKQVNFEVAIAEMHPRIPWELVSDPSVFADHSLGTTGLGGCE